LKRRWPVVLLAGILIALSVAVISTLLSTRSIEGAVPGRAPILGLAALDGGFIAGTETGVFVSSNGKAWSQSSQFAGKPALVASSARSRAAVLSGGVLFETMSLSNFVRGPAGPMRAAAIVVEPSGSVYIATGPGRLLVLGAGGALKSKGLLGDGPKEIVAFDVAPPAGESIFTGGLQSGVWRRLPGQRWQRVLKTPTRAVIIDDADPKRILIGTAGGILMSKDQGISWAFTAMRLPVEALAQHGRDYFALSENRILYKSSDAKAWKTTALPP